MILEGISQSIVATIGTTPTATAPTYFSTYEARGTEGGGANSVGLLSATSTDYTIVPPPASGEALEVEGIVIVNADTAANLVTVSLKEGSTKYPLFAITLSAGDVFAYSQGGITVLDSVGREKQTVSSLALVDGDNFVLGTSTGTKLGTATNQKLGFWNATPVIQPASASQASVITTSATQTTPYGFATQAQADAIVTLVNALRSALVTAGLIKGAA